MPVYEYQGQHYDISETDPSKAKEKIIAHLGKSEPEAKVSVEGAPADIPKTEYKPATGLTTPQVTEGGAALMAPTSLRKEVPIAKQTFGFDPSRINKVPMAEYGSNIGKGALVGGGIGGVIGGFTGPGALVTAAGGAVMGAASGLAESVAKDLGYGTGTQTLAGLATGMPMPVKNTVDFLAKSKLASSVFNKAEDVIMGMIPKYGIARKVSSLFKSEPTIAGREAEKALGVDAKTIGVGGNDFRQAAKAEIEAEHGVGTTGNGMYEKAKEAYDSTGAKFLESDQYKQLVNKLPEGTKAAQEARLKSFFTNEQGMPETGDVIINKLKSREFNALSKREKDAVRNTFNDYLEKTTGTRAEENARKVFEKERVAQAKDELPFYFEKGRAEDINKQIFNYAKDEAGAKMFKQEFASYLSGRPVSEAKKLWGDIADGVRTALIKDPVEFQKISDVINNSQTQKDLSRAKTLIIKSTYGAYETQRKKK